MKDIFYSIFMNFHDMTLLQKEKLIQIFQKEPIRYDFIDFWIWNLEDPKEIHSYIDLENVKAIGTPVLIYDYLLFIMKIDLEYTIRSIDNKIFLNYFLIDILLSLYKTHSRDSNFLYTKIIPHYSRKLTPPHRTISLI